MRIILKRPSAELLLAGMGDEAAAEVFHADLSDKVRRLHGTDVEVDMSLLGDGGVELLESIAKEAGDRSILGQVGTYRRILTNPKEARISRLTHLEGALVEYPRGCDEGLDLPPERQRGSGDMGGERRAL